MLSATGVNYNYQQLLGLQCMTINVIINDNYQLQSPDTANCSKSFYKKLMYNSLMAQNLKIMLVKVNIIIIISSQKYQINRTEVKQ